MMSLVFVFLEPCYPSPNQVSGTSYINEDGKLLQSETDITKVVDKRSDTCLDTLSTTTSRLEMEWVWNECGKNNIAKISVSGDNLVCEDPHVVVAYKHGVSTGCTNYHACDPYNVTHDAICSKTVCHYQCQASLICDTKTVRVHIDNKLHKSWTLCEVSFQ